MMAETKPGMGSWTEEDIRRIVLEVLRENEKLNMQRMLSPLGYAIVELPDAQSESVESEATPEELDYNATYHPTD